MLFARILKLISFYKKFCKMMIFSVINNSSKVIWKLPSIRFMYLLLYDFHPCYMVHFSFLISFSGPLYLIVLLLHFFKALLLGFTIFRAWMRKFVYFWISGWYHFCFQLFSFSLISRKPKQLTTQLDTSVKQEREAASNYLRRHCNDETEK